jgi:hypothetical protein
MLLQLAQTSSKWYEVVGVLISSEGFDASMASAAQLAVPGVVAAACVAVDMCCTAPAQPLRTAAAVQQSVLELVPNLPVTLARAAMVWSGLLRAAPKRDVLLTQYAACFRAACTQALPF